MSHIQKLQLAPICKCTMLQPTPPFSLDWCSLVGILPKSLPKEHDLYTHRKESFQMTSILKNLPTTVHSHYSGGQGVDRWTGERNGTSNGSTKKTSYAGSIVPGISTALATGDGMGPDEGTTRESCWPLDRPAVHRQYTGCTPRSMKLPFPNPAFPNSERSHGWKACSRQTTKLFCILRFIMQEASFFTNAIRDKCSVTFYYGQS